MCRCFDKATNTSFNEEDLNIKTTFIENKTENFKKEEIERESLYSNYEQFTRTQEPYEFNSMKNSQRIYSNNIENFSRSNLGFGNRSDFYNKELYEAQTLPKQAFTVFKENPEERLFKDITNESRNYRQIDNTTQEKPSSKLSLQNLVSDEKLHQSDLCETSYMSIQRGFSKENGNNSLLSDSKNLPSTRFIEDIQPTNKKSVIKFFFSLNKTI